MGLFDWFRPKSHLRLSVWLDEVSRLGALTSGIEADLRRGNHVMVVAHFKDALLQIGERLAGAAVPFTTKATWSDAEARKLIVQKEPSAVFLLAEALPTVSPDAPRPEAISGSKVLSFRLVDLHVLDDENDKVERYARNLPCPVQLSASVSFESPWMQTFASPWVRTMMERMGLKPGHCIESPMVTSTLRKALRKFAKRAKSNHRCDSIADWLQRNVPK